MNTHPRIWVICAAILTLMKAVHAQPPVEWTRSFGIARWDWGRAVSQSADGGYAIAGYSEFSDHTAAWVVKAAANGDSLWSHSFAVASSQTEARNIVSTSDGGYVAVGRQSVSGAPWTLWMAKLSPTGDSLWSRTFNLWSCYGLRVQELADGGLLAIGIADFAWPVLYSELMVVRCNANGDNATVEHHSLQSDGHDEFYDVEPTSDGGWIVAGRHTPASANPDMLALKLDSLYRVEWRQTFGGPYGDFGYAAIEVDSGYVIAGQTSSYGAGSADMWAVKVSHAGGMVWSQTYGGSSNDECWGIAENSVGGLLFWGGTYSFGAGDGDGWLVGTDGQGNILWSQTVGQTGWDTGYKIIHTIDGGYALTGLTYTGFPSSWDFWLVKLGSDLGTSLRATPVSGYSLAAYPNPFNATVTLVFSLAHFGVATIAIYDVLGREAVKPVRGSYAPGEHRMQINGAGLPSGIYFARIAAGDVRLTRKLLLLK